MAWALRLPICYQRSYNLVTRSSSCRSAAWWNSGENYWNANTFSCSHFRQMSQPLARHISIRHLLLQFCETAYIIDTSDSPSHTLWYLRLKSILLSAIYAPLPDWLNHWHAILFSLSTTSSLQLSFILKQVIISWIENFKFGGPDWWQFAMPWTVFYFLWHSLPSKKRVSWNVGISGLCWYVLCRQLL